MREGRPANCTAEELEAANKAVIKQLSAQRANAQ
jgi:hypothetical protein